MTSPQLRHALGRLGLSQMELARRLKVDPRTVRHWVAGTYPVPEAVALLLGCWQREQRKRPESEDDITDRHTLRGLERALAILRRRKRERSTKRLDKQGRGERPRGR